MQISTFEKDLGDGLRGILAVRAEMKEEQQENEFDAVVEPIRWAKNKINYQEIATF